MLLLLMLLLLLLFLLLGLLQGPLFGDSCFATTARVASTAGTTTTFS